MEEIQTKNQTLKPPCRGLARGMVRVLHVLVHGHLPEAGRCRRGLPLGSPHRRHLEDRGFIGAAARGFERGGDVVEPGEGGAPCPRRREGGGLGEGLGRQDAEGGLLQGRRRRRLLVALPTL